MSQSNAPRLPKWPFFAADLLLLAVAAWIVWQAPKPLTTWPLICVLACTSIGAWICILPFLRQYQADFKFAEADKLTEAVEQISNLRSFTNQISFATAQWQVIQENSAKTVNAAKQIADGIAADAKAFSEFMLKANDAEKAHLRMQVEKARRGEGDWIQLVVHLLDHIYALQQAATRSGQQNVIAQLTQFQTACRELVRRVGLLPVEVKIGEPYDEKTHTLPDKHPKPAPGSVVAQVMATGYTFQGQPVRNALVVVVKPSDSTPPAKIDTESASEPQSQLDLQAKT
jgi:molecular chaperone GrpE (heat shock protein)